MASYSNGKEVPAPHLEKDTALAPREDSSDEADFKDSTEELPSETPSEAPSDIAGKDADEKLDTVSRGSPEISAPAEGSAVPLPETKLTKKQRKKQAQKQKKAVKESGVGDDETEKSVDEKTVNVDEPSHVTADTSSDTKTEDQAKSTPPSAPPSMPPRTSIPNDVLAAAGRQANSIKTEGSGNSEGTTLGTPLPPSSSLLEARQSSISLTFDAKDTGAQHAIRTGVASVQKTYRDIRSTTGHLPSELVGSEPVDWPLWDRVMADYHDMVVQEPQKLAAAVAAGIPSAVRGIVWQMVARSKNLQLEELYMHLKTEPCVHEKAIRRDLTRTSFFTSVDAAHKAEELYSVIHAYASFDPDVGYTQGMVFIAVPLIMNMTESECFCLLTTLMKEYGLRDLFCPEMHGLHLLLHQFDRLLAQQSPLLFNHLCHRGVRSSMYASQWFLTFFSYKFPFKVVLRIFDMVITQGVEAVLRLALSLMIKNEAQLLALDFDGLLAFLKDSLFDVYVGSAHVTPDVPNRRFSLLGARKPAGDGSEHYKLDAFIQDAMQVDVDPHNLAKWRAEFDAIVAKDAQRKLAIDQLRAENGVLRGEIKDVEMQMYALNHDHVGAVQGLVDVKVALPEVLGDVGELRKDVARLEADIAALEAKLGAEHDSIPEDIETQIQGLLAQNAAEAERFTSLEEQLAELSVQDEELAAELKKNKKWFWK